MHNENEKRIDGREMCSGLVEISFHDQRGNLVLEKGLLEDLSKDGFCISLSIPITVGLKMEFRCDGLVGIASVRYCNLGDYGTSKGGVQSTLSCYRRSRVGDGASHGPAA